MRHLKKGRKLGTDASHTTAMLRSLAIALFTSERIKTTETRAKEVRSLVEKIITWGKKGDVHSRRLAMAELGDKTMLSTVTLATTGGMVAVWLGSTIGMMIADGLAIMIGVVMGKTLPEKLITRISGTIFILFGVSAVVAAFMG